MVLEAIEDSKKEGSPSAAEILAMRIAVKRDLNENTFKYLGVVSPSTASVLVAETQAEAIKIQALSAVEIERVKSHTQLEIERLKSEVEMASIRVLLLKTL